MIDFGKNAQKSFKCSISNKRIFLKLKIIQFAILFKFVFKLKC